MMFKTFSYSAKRYAEIMGIEMEELYQRFGGSVTRIAIVEMLDNEGFQIGKIIDKYINPKTFVKLIDELITQNM